MSGTVIQPQPACTMGAEGAHFDVVFATMTNGQYAATVSIPSDDPLNPTITVNVQGTKSN
jgi:hypothetical protein